MIKELGYAPISIGLIALIIGFWLSISWLFTKFPKDQLVHPSWERIGYWLILAIQIINLVVMCALYQEIVK